MNLRPKIRRVLDKPDAVVFVGSGVSRWSGLPSWAGLIDQLATFLESEGLSADLVRRELDGGDLLQAASFGVDQMTKSQFAQFIRQSCRRSDARPHAIHEKLTTLGPNCFITTNYDTLIEDALREWRDDQVFRKVTNRQITETADLVQATSSFFVFKPHGDVEDADSIILTREQYRAMHGDLRHVLEAMKTLLVSRPVFFAGFGLRDPDFLYLKDVLANIYQGAARDHYAVVPDVSDQEYAYWRKHFGVHLLSYPTKNGGSDHSALLDVLDSLAGVSDSSIGSSEVSTGTEPLDLSDPELALTMMRYAARVTRIRPEPLEFELPLIVSAESETIDLRKSDNWRFHEAPVERLMANVHENAVLLGSPGAGKSYALRNYAAVLAYEMQQVCLKHPVDLSAATIPVYLDLKLYTGNLWKMAVDVMPAGVSLAELTETAHVRFLIDSVNELPREHFENGTFERDVAHFLSQIRGSTVLFASRTDEGLRHCKLDTFRLLNIAVEFIEDILTTANVDYDGVYRRDIVWLLQKPLFFRQFHEGKLQLRSDVHPSRAYQSVVDGFTAALETEIHHRIPLDEVLGALAYHAINDGVEAFALGEAMRQIQRHELTRGLNHRDIETVINWLIARRFFVPAAGMRLTFYHQSLTEFLAAKRLAKLFRASPDILDECLKTTRWDQALLLTLGFLDATETSVFVHRVIETDIELAMRASRFLEFNRDEFVSEVLISLVNHEPEDLVKDIRIGHLLAELPVSAVHEPVVEEVLDRGGEIGGGAAELLVALCGEKANDRLIDAIFQRFDDYNYCQAVGSTLATFITATDVDAIVRRLAQIDSVGKDFREEPGGVGGVAKALSQFPADVISDCFGPLDKLNDVQVEVLSDWVQEDDTEEGFRLLVGLVKTGNTHAAFPLHLRLSDPRQNRFVNLLDEQVVDCLISALFDSDAAPWSA